MLDVNIFKLVREQDFLLRPSLDLRPYVWGSLEVYADAVQTRMSQYHSKYDLLHWLTFWTESARLASPFTGEPAYERLKEESCTVHQTVLRYLFDAAKINSAPHAGYDIWNAIDGHVTSVHCSDVKTVLDFGSGYGRLGAVFAGPARGGNFIAVDCIEISYLLQNLFLSLMAPGRFYEYCDYAFERRDFFVNLDKENLVYHLPSWRLDLVPDKKVDLVTSVFVLPEINQFALLDFIQQAKRIVRPGGYIYLRDHLYHKGDDGHQGAHRLDTSVLLEKAGFEQIYEGNYRDNEEIYGIPRIYKKSHGV